MSAFSPIGWTDATWPIVAGCDYESPGCSNCWAVRDSWRLMHSPFAQIREAFAGVVRKLTDGRLVWTGEVRPIYERLKWPLVWRKARRIFVCSQSDLFHPRVPFEFVAAAFGVMAMASWHTYQVLTKHPARALEFFAWADAQQGGALATCLWYARKSVGPDLANRFDPYPDKLPDWPLANVWFGVTVEDQRRADERIPLLCKIPARVRWISAEPLLERVELGLMGVLPGKHFSGYQMVWQLIHWVVVGGESAQTRKSTRPFDLAWAYALLKECREAGVAFFMKQLGTKPLTPSKPGQVTLIALGMPPPAGKSSRYKWHEPEYWPEDLRVQEFPDELKACGCGAGD